MSLNESSMQSAHETHLTTTENLIPSDLFDLPPARDLSVMFDGL